MLPDWIEEVAEIKPSVGDDAVEAMLVRGTGGRKTKTGRRVPLPTLRNVAIVLQHDPRWAGQVRFNEFDRQLYSGDRVVTDDFETDVAIWLSEVYGLDVGSTLAGEALRHAGHQSPINPLQSYLDGLRWDGSSRVDTFLPTYFRTATNELHREIGRRWLISAVSRAYDPGCKVDTTLMLAGGQGSLKSSGLRMLAVRPEWFSDTTLDLRSKDAYQALSGVWLYEVAELESFKSTNTNVLKAFLSSERDRYRPPYGRNVQTVARSNVFVGTTNDEEFLRDPTGSRRFWPVRVGVADLAALGRDRDQLWAEAVHLFKSGEPWHLDLKQERALRRHSERFREVDAWEPRIEQWAAAQDRPFTAADVFEGALGRRVGTARPEETMRVGGILTRLGYQKRRTAENGERHVRWSRAGRTPRKKDRPDA